MQFNEILNIVENNYQTLNKFIKFTGFEHVNLGYKLLVLSDRSLCHIYWYFFICTVLISSFFVQKQTD